MYIKTFKKTSAWRVGFIAIALLSGCAQTGETKRYTEAELREKLTEVAGYSYETGCLNMALQLCSGFKDPTTRGRCFDYGNRTCPNMSARYRRWIGDKK